MEPEFFLTLLGFLLVVAFLAEEAFARLRVPPVLVLMACGLGLGPFSRVLPVDRFVEVAPHFGALAFLLILFEGGLDLDVRDVAVRLRAGIILGSLGFLVASAATAALAAATGFPPTQAFVLGIVLAPISGAIVIPLLAQLGLRRELRTLLVLEAALADVIAVLAMGVAGTLLTAGGLAGLLAMGTLLAAMFSFLLAVACGLLWPRVLQRLGDRRFADVLTFGVALVLWGMAEIPGASGALAVLAFGLTLTNERSIWAMLGVANTEVGAIAGATVARLHGFIGQLTFVVRAYFFVFLGVVVSFFYLPWKWYALASGVVLAMLAARHAVLTFVEEKGLCGLSRRERRAVLLTQPRGLVSAVLAVQASRLGIDEDGTFLGIASLVIILTNLLLIAAARATVGADTAGWQPETTSG